MKNPITFVQKQILRILDLKPLFSHEVGLKIGITPESASEKLRNLEVSGYVRSNEKELWTLTPQGRGGSFVHAFNPMAITTLFSMKEFENLIEERKFAAPEKKDRGTFPDSKKNVFPIIPSINMMDFEKWLDLTDVKSRAYKIISKKR